MRSLKLPKSARSSFLKKKVASATSFDPNDDQDSEDTKIKCPRHGQLLREFVLKQIGLRQAKSFHEILDDVHNDYGSVASRTVHRVLSQLVQDRVIAHVVSPHFGISVSGYVRIESPLLWETGGFAVLVDMLEDAAASGRSH